MVPNVIWALVFGCLRAWGAGSWQGNFGRRNFFGGNGVWFSLAFFRGEFFFFSVKQTLLIFELRMIGDAIMSLPFVRAARERFEVRVVCAPGCVAVFETVLAKENVIAWQPPWLAESGKYAWRRWRECGLRTLVRRVREVRAEVAVSVWADARVHVLLALSGARERVGFPMLAVNHYASHLAWRRRQLVGGAVLNSVAGLVLGRRLLTRKLVRANYRQHHVENWRQLAEALGLAWDVATPWFAGALGEISPNDGGQVEERNRGRSAEPCPPSPVADGPCRAMRGAPIHGEGVRSSENILANVSGVVSENIRGVVARARAAGRAVWLVHPGGRVPEQRWALENFERVIREVLLPAGVLVLVVKPPEISFGPQWEGLAPVIAPGNLAELFAVVGLAEVLLCNDTGVAHVGAAWGKRVVGIFTASEADWFAPWGSREDVVRQAVCVHHPCLGRCVMPRVICREAVTVELVAARVRQVLAERAVAVGSRGAV